MEVDRAVRQSLQEIAQLLLLLHDKYRFQDLASDRDVLINLSAFIRSIGLEHKVCVLDIEYCRRKAVQRENIGNSSSLGYETFYSWLKEIASTYFKYESISSNDKKSFHSLLTKHIIPSSRIKTEESPINNETQNWLLEVDTRTMETFIEYKELLKIWYLTLLTQSEGYRLAPSDLYWKLIHNINSSVTISSSYLFSSLKTANICPTFVSTGQLLNIFREVQNVNSDQETQELNFTFIQFLRVLQSISNEIHSSYSSVGDYNGNPRLRSILMFFSVTSMKLVLNSFCEDELDYQSTNLEDTISTSSILWLLRQSGAILLEDVAIRNILELVEFEIQRSEDQYIKTNIGVRVKYDAIPGVLSRIVHKIKKLSTPLPETDSLSDNKTVNEEKFINWVIFLSYFLPGCFFASSTKTVIMRGLPTLYSPYLLQSLNAQYSVWENAISGYIKFRLSKEPSSIDDINSIGWTINTAVEYCESTGFIPKILSQIAFREVAEFLVWPFGESTPMIGEVNLPMVCLMEALFIVSQQLLSEQEYLLMDNNVVFTSFKVIIERFQGIFDNVQNNSANNSSLSITPPRPQKSSSLNALTVDERFSNSLTPNRINQSPYSINEVLAVFSFVPIQSFLLNPWDISHLICDVVKNWNSAVFELSIQSSVNRFCNKYKLDKEFVYEYLGSYFEFHNEVDSHSIKSSSNRINVLIKPSNIFPVDRLFNIDIISLLSSNEALLKWEFCRCYSAHANDHQIVDQSFNHPLPINIDNPLAPISFMISDNSRRVDGNALYLSFNLPKVAAISWAEKTLGLSHDISKEVFKRVISCTREKYESLSFSMFVIFMIECATFELGVSADTSSSVQLSLNTALEKVNDLLLKLSQNVTKVQKALRMPILSPLFSDSDQLDSVDSCFPIIQISLHFFKQYSSFQVTMVKSLKSLPPRPPEVLLDAARFLGYCKYLGILEGLGEGSIAKSWSSFGSYIRKCNTSGIDAWPLSVVPPLPIKMESLSIFHLLNNLAERVYESNQAQVILAKIVLPYICSVVLNTLVPPRVYISRELPNDLALCRSAVAPFEDLIRYGGHKAISALEKFQFNLYSALNYSTEYPCVSFDKLCESKVFGYPNLLNKEVIEYLAYLSFHPRTRESTETWQSLSCVESMELFIRCACFAWEKYNINKDKNLARSVQVKEYLKECNASQLHNSDQTWGVDLLSPFAASVGIANPSVVIQRSLSSPKTAKIPTEVKLLESSAQITKPSTPKNLASPQRSKNSIERKPPSLKLSPAASTNINISKPSIMKNEDSSLSSKPSKDTQVQESSDKREKKVSAFPLTPVAKPALYTSTSESTVSDNFNSAFLESTKEVLWPVFATYCSCGDSIDPGRLSGPNLFALLSKLGVLTDLTYLSAIGLLLHQISTLALVQVGRTSVLQGISEASEAPSLAFEEFLIFLCAFAQLRYDDSISAPIYLSDQSIDQSGGINEVYPLGADEWQNYLASSEQLSRLLSECVLPVLKRQAVLASPDDARERDNYRVLFSLEVILSIEKAEHVLLQTFHFEREKYLSSSSQSPSFKITLLQSLERMHLLPQVVTATQISQLIADVAPGPGSVNNSSPHNSSSNLDNSVLSFPCWAWVIAVVAFSAVDNAVSESEIPTDPAKIPTLVAALISDLASAMNGQNLGSTNYESDELVY